MTLQNQPGRMGIPLKGSWVTHHADAKADPSLAQIVTLRARALAARLVLNLANLDSPTLLRGADWSC